MSVRIVAFIPNEKNRTQEEAVRESCRYCADFTVGRADVSVGLAGSAERYSTMIIRSKGSERLLDLIEFSRGDVNKEEIRRIVRFKREKVKGRF